MLQGLSGLGLTEKSESIIFEYTYFLQFNAFNIPSLNKMSIDSQLQGPSTGFIDKTNLVSQNPYSINNYSLGETNLTQNPIVHPVNSYQFDYSRLYNPLINKK